MIKNLQRRAETVILPNSRHQKRSGGRDHAKTSMIHYKHQSGQLKILRKSITISWNKGAKKITLANYGLQPLSF